MEKNSYVVVVDLGTSNVVVAVGLKQNDGIEVLSIVSKPAKGVVAGMIENIEEVSVAIKEAITEVEDSAGIRIVEAYAGISGDFVRCARHADHVFTYDPQNGVCAKDVEMLFDRMRNIQAPDGEVIMERIPQNYVVDDNREVKNPVGSFGKKLSSTFNFILCQKTPMERLGMALKRLGIELLQVFPNSITIPEAVLSSDEKEEGVAVVDIGGGTTDVTVYYRNVIRYTATIPMGALAINRDIRSMSVPDKYVERLKVGYGHAVADLAPENRLIRVNGRTVKEAKDILLRNLATVIEARATDIAEFVLQEIRDSNFGSNLAYGIVLTGGSAHLRDIDELFRRVTGMDVRIAVADIGIVESSCELVDDPSYTTAVSLLIKGAKLGSCIVDERPIKVVPVVVPTPQPIVNTSTPQPEPVVAYTPPQPIAQPVVKPIIKPSVPQGVVGVAAQPIAPHPIMQPQVGRSGVEGGDESLARVVESMTEPVVGSAVSEPIIHSNDPVGQDVKKSPWAKRITNVFEKLNNSFSATDDDEI